MLRQRIGPLGKGRRRHSCEALFGPTAPSLAPCGRIIVGSQGVEVTGDAPQGDAAAAEQVDLFRLSLDFVNHFRVFSTPYGELQSACCHRTGPAAG